MKSKKFRSILALGLAAMMTMSACGSEGVAKTGSETLSSTASEATSSEAASEKVAEEPVEISIWLLEVEGFDYENNDMTRDLEERFNVDIKFEFTSPSESTKTAYNLMLASGEYPDILLGRQLNAAQITAGVEAGALLPLNEYIVEGTNFKRALDENESWEKNLTTMDGNIYSFMYTDVGVHKISEYKMWYRADWLEALGWENPPSTPEEFKEYLIAIRDNDVNGNGDATDEIPLMGYYGGRKTDPICFLMNPFELYTDKYYYITEDNEIHFSAVTDGWREGLAYIADLYAEGLIAEETYVQDQATFKALLNKTGKDALIGTFPVWYNGQEIDTNMMSWFTYEALAPLAGKYQQSAANDESFAMLGAISTTCEYPEIAFAMMDYMIGDDFHTGVEGEDFEWVNEESWIGTTPSLKELDDDGIKNDGWNAGQWPVWDSAEKRYGKTKDESLFETDNTWLLLKAAEKYEPYYVKHNIPSVVWASEDVITAESEYSTLINEYILTANTEFVMGRKDINNDADWQEYLDTLDSMGLQEYIELLYTYYGLK